MLKKLVQQGPQRAKWPGGAYRTSCEPFPYQVDLGEQINSTSAILLHG